MRKLFIILSVLAITLTSGQCTEKAIVVQGNPDKEFDRITNFQYNNHSYIRFDDGTFENRVSAVVHDPDCQCMQNDTIK